MLTVEFNDDDSASAAFMNVRPAPGIVAISFGVAADGDLDLLVSAPGARCMAAALMEAADAASVA